MFVHFEPESSGSSKSVHTAHVCFGKKLNQSSIQQGVSILSISSLHFHIWIFHLHILTLGFYSLHFHPQIFHPCIFQFDKGLPNAVSDFFSHQNILFGVFVYFLGSLKQYTYKTQGSILYYPHLDIGTFKVQKYLLSKYYQQ